VRPDWTAVEDLQPSIHQQSSDLIGFRVAVAMEVREHTTPRRWAEVRDERASARLHNPSHLVCTGDPRGARQMMQHNSAQHDIEAPIRKRKDLDDRLLKSDVECSPSSFSGRARDHLRRRINAVNGTSGSDAPFGGHGKTAGAAPDIQHGLADLDTRQREKTLAERTFPPTGHQPGEQVISGRAMENPSWRLTHRSQRRLDPWGEEEQEAAFCSERKIDGSSTRVAPFTRR
jgi:hypothetical protein